MSVRIARRRPCDRRGIGRPAALRTLFEENARSSRADRTMGETFCRNGRRAVTPSRMRTVGSNPTSPPLSMPCRPAVGQQPHKLFGSGSNPLTATVRPCSSTAKQHVGIVPTAVRFRSRAPHRLAVAQRKSTAVRWQVVARSNRAGETNNRE